MRNLSELMREIAGCRADILQRETVRDDLERRLHADLRPLESRMIEIRIETFRLLGKHLQSGWLPKRDRKTLELALLDFANELEDRFGVDLAADRNRFLNEDPYTGDEEETEDQDQEQDEGGNGSGADDAHSGGFREQDFRKGGAKQEGRSQPASKPEPKEEAFAGDLRALYLMLARALHPDKEADPARRDGKTAWMQKVTAAYANRDLAALLDILGRNPLDAVGPYLSQAPLKTVQGFAKRLRRELAALRSRVTALDAGLDPFFAAFIRRGQVDESAYKRHLAEVKKDVKFMKQRRDAYATSQGVRELIDALRVHEWHDLM